MCVCLFFFLFVCIDHQTNVNEVQTSDRKKRAYIQTPSRSFGEKTTKEREKEEKRKAITQHRHEKKIITNSIECALQQCKNCIENFMKITLRPKTNGGNGKSGKFQEFKYIVFGFFRGSGRKIYWKSINRSIWHRMHRRKWHQKVGRNEDERISENTNNTTS